MVRRAADDIGDRQDSFCEFSFNRFCFAMRTDRRAHIMMDAAKRITHVTVNMRYELMAGVHIMQCYCLSSVLYVCMWNLLVLLRLHLTSRLEK